MSSIPLLSLSAAALRLLLGDLVEYRIDYFIDHFLYLINLVNNAISERNDQPHVYLQKCGLFPFFFTSCNLASGNMQIAIPIISKKKPIKILGTLQYIHRSQHVSPATEISKEKQVSSIFQDCNSFK